MKNMLLVITMLLGLAIPISNNLHITEQYPNVHEEFLDLTIPLSTITRGTEQYSNAYTEFKMEKIVEESEELAEEFYPLSDEEIDLLALLTMAEAEGECEEGQRLVIDTVLNRVDSEYWPDTVTEVIYQPDQFTSMWNDRVNRCEVQEYFRELVIEELKSRTNYDVVFFRTEKYSKYGTPLFAVENHYFSSFEGVD